MFSFPSPEEHKFMQRYRMQVRKYGKLEAGDGKSKLLAEENLGYFFFKLGQTNQLCFYIEAIFLSHNQGESVNVCRQTMRGGIDPATEIELCLPSQELTKICIYTGDELRQRTTYPPHSALSINT